MSCPKGQFSFTGTHASDASDWPVIRLLISSSNKNVLFQRKSFLKQTIDSSHWLAAMNGHHHFNDVNYLTGRRMQRNHNHAKSNDREQHLKRSLKSGLRKSRDPPPPRDDANLFAKIMREKQLLHPSSRTQRVTTEPNLDIFGVETKHAPSMSPSGDIFGNQNRRDHLGIFGQSKYSSSYDYKRERKRQTKTKSRKRETELLPKTKPDYQPETYSDVSFIFSNKHTRSVSSSSKRPRASYQPENYSDDPIVLSDYTETHSKPFLRSSSKKSKVPSQSENPYFDASFFFFDQPEQPSNSSSKESKSKSKVVYQSETPRFSTSHHGSFKLNPLEENLEYINQLIEPDSYENAKWIVDSSNLFV